ncbi:UNC-like C-terminal-domain-containing protein [Radiomyces spectabilis]|uniref:UNC-like C-terminal-domain-containing protein n=1 Tax=Radiomyces spectabilis TaxID=64574 RepID=UPI00221E387F|nr:UNC-like C-terminal-domain-containing protein [Radiomyces spectabilis]KAI8374631.1 UNC-like C-terminal-domain-containing protein [Radiomyces spectabilis]
MDPNRYTSRASSPFSPLNNERHRSLLTSRSPYKRPSSRLSELRDTSVNIATAISQTKHTSPSLPKPDFLGDKNNESPLHAFGSEDKVFIQRDPKTVAQERAMDEFFGGTMEDDLDDDSDIYEEEELLANDPVEECRRRHLYMSGFGNNESKTASRDRFKTFTPMADSPSDTESIISSDDDDNDDDGVDTLWSKSKVVWDRTFEFVMFWVFMIFWTIKEVTMVLGSALYLLASSIIVNPIVFILQYLGYARASPLQSLPFSSSTVRQPGMASILACAVAVYTAIMFLASTNNLRDIPRLSDLIAYPGHLLSPMRTWSRPSLHTSTPSNPLIHVGGAPTLDQVSDQINQLRLLLQKEQARIDGLASNTNQIQAFADLAADTVTKVNAMQSTLDRLDKSVGHMQPKFKDLQDAVHALQQRIQQQTPANHDDLYDQLRSFIEEILPPNVYVHVNQKTGKFQVEGIFNYIQQYFVARSEFQTLQDTLEDRQARSEGDLGGSLDLTWDQFLQANEASMQQFLTGSVEQVLDQQMKQGVIMSKDMFMELLTNELHSIWDELNKFQAPDNDNTSLSPRGVWMLVERALERYHQDVLGSADYALANRGARVIPAWTSATYVAYPRHLWKRWLARLTGVGAFTPVSPTMALTSDTGVGQCWPMQGHNGTLGIALSEPIAIQGVTIEHPSRDILVNMTTAPKDIEVWGVKGRHFRSKLRPWEEESDGRAIKLAVVRYDIRKPQAIQTFDIALNRYVIFDAVLLRVLSNWGDSDYTCLYRVRVHGAPAEQNR